MARASQVMGWRHAFAMAVVVPFLLPAGVQGQTENDFQRELCAGMKLEVQLPSGGRVDCVSDTHAIEVEFSEKWAEGLGQALHYAAVTGKEPGIILICRQKETNCLQHALRLEEAIAFWELPVTVWRHDASYSTTGP